MPPPIPVEIVPYSITWPEQARHEIERIAAALGSAVCGIHHIGSTAIPGLAAKPILDLMPMAADLALVDELAPALERLGYCCWGELGIPGRRYCTRDSETGTRLIQLHCFTSGSPHVERHLAFRDYLREHPSLAATYQAEKQRCAAIHPSDSHAYSDCKAGWIVRIEAEAIAWCRARGITPAMPATPPCAAAP